MYDAQVGEYDSHAHDVLFGMAFPFVKCGKRMLDIGIGTGLASIHFTEIGLQVYGLDHSTEMLETCRAKSFALELGKFDVVREAIPYPDRFFDHVVCCGLFHFVRDLSGPLAEVARVLKEGGVFAFTYAPGDFHDDCLEEPTGWGIPIFRHSTSYLEKLLKRGGLEQLKEQRLLMKGANKISYDHLFSALICRKV